MTTSWSRGNSTVTFLRLCSRAPRTTIRSWGTQKVYRNRRKSNRCFSRPHPSSRRLGPRSAVRRAEALVARSDRDRLRLAGFDGLVCRAAEARESLPYAGNPALAGVTTGLDVDSHDPHTIADAASDGLQVGRPLATAFREEGLIRCL